MRECTCGAGVWMARGTWQNFTVPDGVKVNVVENTATEITCLIPALLSNVPDEVRAGVAGGVFNQNYFVRNSC